MFVLSVFFTMTSLWGTSYSSIIGSLWETSNSNASCTCWDGYKVEDSESGPQCVAVSQFHIMPCNMPRLPKCECSGGVSSILKDTTGTWCTKYSKGEELMRWPCENTKEWDSLFRKHPDLTYTRYQLCKTAHPPVCRCSGELTNIVKDSTGTWCLTYSNTKEERRWPCENAVEWKEYWKKHPYFIYC